MAGASLVLKHFVNRIAYSWIASEFGIQSFRRSDWFQPLGTKRILSKKLIDALSRPCQHSLDGIMKSLQLLSELRGQATLALGPPDLLKEGLAFVTGSRLAHTQNEL